MSTARFGLRATNALRQLPRQNLRSTVQRRYQSTAEQVAQDAAKEETAFAKFFNSPVGPKTVHFWAPIMKWGVVLAGAADFARPASQLSISQNLALMATGSIWTRWCFIIKPRNLFLASVNFCLFLVGTAQVARATSYQRSLKAEGIVPEGTQGTLEKLVQEPEKAPEKIKEAVVGK